MGSASLFVIYPLADYQLLNFANLMVGDAHKIGTLSKIADMDGMSSRSVDILVVDNTATHVNKRAIDRTLATLNVQGHPRGGWIGFKHHTHT